MINELTARDTSHLSVSQNANRAAAIDHLRRYRAEGVFPVNTKFATFTPYFIDRVGTRCAMAYLIEQSGAVDLVAHVARTANNAYVQDLAQNPALVAWLAKHGLTTAEAARIQPTYEPPQCEHECRDDEQCVFHEQGTACSMKCDGQIANECGAESTCTPQFAGSVCYPPVVAEGPRPDESCAVAGGGMGLGFLMLVGAIIIAIRRRRFRLAQPNGSDSLHS